MKAEETTTSTTTSQEVIEEFQGYTIEELRYQRAMLALRKEYSKTRLIQSLSGLNPNNRQNKLSEKQKSRFGFMGKLANKVFSNLNLVDYALMGISAIGTIRKGYRLIRGKK